ncbi:glycosyltransferase family 2 protein [Pseudomonas fluorescens]|uniref:glycosyltransferase family 2 protein n=1 Tax=Pseudomonas fluorescens TaxID=294 RepID=UPI001A9E6C4A|nr:glycosyltransferase family 2 protein [Pseudomonas fluorescens]QTD34579.1 glycosyltransferase family 2 protein [Pseudomonas fluorescens]
MTTKASTPHISVIVPVYKAEKSLDELYSRLKKSLEEITVNFEILLVEDCGGDSSWKIIERLANDDPRVLGIQLSRNFGQHYGITAGLDACRGEWVVVMDCDLQDRPEEIPRLYAKAQEGYDIVLALRGKRSHPLLKRFTSWMFYKLFSYLADFEYDGDSGNFRIISRKVVDNLCQMRERLRFFGALVHWTGFNTTGVEITHAERSEGKSTYTYSKLWNLAMETIIAYSDKPLRLAVKLGFTMALLSFLYGSYLLFTTMLHGAVVQGWTSLMVSIFFIGGVVISIQGIVGIYVGKTFDETKKRPLYIVGRQTFETRRKTKDTPQNRESEIYVDEERF